MYWRFDALSPLNFAVMARLAGLLDLEQLRAALVAVQERHPLLRVCVLYDDKGTPWFRESLGQLTVDVASAGRDQVWSILEEGLNTPIYTPRGPLLFVRLLRHDPSDHTLQVTFHHAISDGRSATFLLRDLLQSMAQQQRGEPADLPHLPPAGYYGDRIPVIDTSGGLRGLRTAWRTVKASALFMRGAGLPVGLSKKRASHGAKPTAAPGSLATKRVHVEPRFLGGEALRALVKRTKAERTTVQCVLNAALSLSVAEDSPPGPLQRTACTQVLDIRARLVPPVGEDCGLFASGLTSLHQIHRETDFWSFAREIRAHMDRSIATPLPFFHSAMHTAVTQVASGLGLSDRKKFSEVMNGIHPEGLAVSNLGRVTLSVEGSPVEITELAFATNTSVLNDLSTSALTFNGTMTWAFNGGAVLSRERLARLADTAMAKIDAAVSPT
jgi:hypothetical protein